MYIYYVIDLNHMFVTTNLSNEIQAKRFCLTKIVALTCYVKHLRFCKYENSIVWLIMWNEKKEKRQTDCCNYLLKRYELSILFRRAIARAIEMAFKN